MKKRIFSILLIITALFVCLLLSLNAMGSEIIVSAQADGGELSSLEAGDVVKVMVTLPKVENTNKLQFDLNFNDSVFGYNGDADARAVLSALNIGKVELVGDDTVRLVAAGLSGVSFESGTIAISASFTVKQGVFGGEKNAFSLSGLKCSDASVTLDSDSVKITILGEEPTIPETTIADETTVPSDVTTADDTTAPPKVTAAVETTSAPDVTTQVITEETSKSSELDTVEDVSTEISDTTIDAIIPDTTSIGDDQTIAEVIDSAAYTSENVENEREGDNDSGSPIVVPVVIVLIVACVGAVVVAFLWSKRIKLPK